MARCLQSAHSAQRNSHADCRFVDRAPGRARGRCGQRRPVRGDLGARERRARADAGGRAVRGARRQLALHRRRLPLRLSRRRRSHRGRCHRSRNEDLENVDFGTYTEEQYFDDMFELTQYRTDPELCEILVRDSLETASWVHRQGVKLQPGLGRQAYKVDGKFKFWGGLALHIWGGGPEMLKALYANAERRGIPIVYETPAVALIRERGRVDRRRGRASRRAGRSQGRRGRARLRRLRIQSGDARALSRAGLGAGEDSRHPLQHGRRPQHGARDRRAALRQLVGLPFGGVGHQRAALWRPHGRRPVPEAQLSVRYPHQRQGRALCRRGRQLPQPHLCEVRRRDHASSRACSPGRCSTPR